MIRLIPSLLVIGAAFALLTGLSWLTLDAIARQQQLTEKMP